MEYSTTTSFWFSVLAIDLCLAAFRTEALSSFKLVERIGSWAALPLMMIGYGTF